MSTVTQHPYGVPSWFDLMTSDAEAARKFYGALFGWTYQVGGPETGHYAMCLRDGKHAAGMGQMTGNEGFPPSWSVYFNVEDVETSVARVKENGGQPMMDVMDVMDAGRMAVCTDSTGAVFGMWQPMQHTGAQIVEEPGAMAWCEVNTRDADGARDFYSTVFALEPKPLDGTPSKYYMLHHGDKAVCGVMEMTAEWGELPPHWMVYFAVADADAAAVTIREHGGEVLHGPFDTPYGRIIVARDPQGAAFSTVDMSKMGQ